MPLEACELLSVTLGTESIIFRANYLHIAEVKSIAAIIGCEVNNEAHFGTRIGT
jgi:hypothetical protein